MVLSSDHPLRLHNLEDVKTRLWDDVRASRAILTDAGLNSESRHVAYGRANAAEQLLICLGETIDVTQGLDG